MYEALCGFVLYMCWFLCIFFTELTSDGNNYSSVQVKWSWTSCLKPVCLWPLTLPVTVYLNKVHCSYLIDKFVWWSAFRWHHRWSPCDLDLVTQDVPDRSLVCYKQLVKPSLFKGIYGLSLRAIVFDTLIVIAHFNKGWLYSGYLAPLVSCVKYFSGWVARK